MYCLHPIQKPWSNNKIKIHYHILSSQTWSQFWVISIIHLCQINQIQMKNLNKHQINHTRWMWIRCKHRLPKEAVESPVLPEMVLNCLASCEKIRLQTPKWPAKTERPTVPKLIIHKMKSSTSQAHQKPKQILRQVWAMSKYLVNTILQIRKWMQSSTLILLKGSSKYCIMRTSVRIRSWRKRAIRKVNSPKMPMMRMRGMIQSLGRNWLDQMKLLLESLLM